MKINHSANQTLNKCLNKNPLVETLDHVAVPTVCGASSVAARTPSDLPECTIGCYIQGIRDAGIALDDFQGQCRSEEFQLGMRDSTAMKCVYEEYLFIYELFN